MRHMLAIFLLWDVINLMLKHWSMWLFFTAFMLKGLIYCFFHSISCNIQWVSIYFWYQMVPDKSRSNLRYIWHLISWNQSSMMKLSPLTSVAFLSKVMVDESLSTLQKLEDDHWEVEREETPQKKLERTLADSEAKRQHEGTLHPPSRSSAQLPYQGQYLSIGDKLFWAMIYTCEAILWQKE